MSNLVGRILLAVLFLFAGINKLKAPAMAAGYFTKLGFPMTDVLVWVVIAVEIGGAILLIAGWKTRWAAWALAAFTVIATFAAHRFWEFSDPGQYTAQMNNFLKNLAVIGGLLILAATGPGAMSADRGKRS
jgi:putative oxidoreductase